MGNSLTILTRSQIEDMTTKLILENKKLTLELAKHEEKACSFQETSISVSCGNQESSHYCGPCYNNCEDKHQYKTAKEETKQDNANLPCKSRKCSVDLSGKAKLTKTNNQTCKPGHPIEHMRLTLRPIKNR